MDADYFRRIDAMHYVLAHDDGQGVAGIREADVCLVGVSRSSKTPTCFYLANRGILLTPFHNMALMCPDTTDQDVDLHTEVFAAALADLAG